MIKSYINIVSRIASRCMGESSARYSVHCTEWNRERLEQLWMRRQILGPDPPTPRSQKPNWNYEAELFAFGSRLKEHFSTDTLRKAFLFKSHLERDRAARADLAENSEKNVVIAEHNQDFIDAGQNIVTLYTKAFLRFYYPKFPEEGIEAVSCYLCSNESLADVARHIGAADLIFSLDFPPKDETLADTFFAIVGGLNHDSGLQKAERFVQDFLLTKLHGKDINEIFNFAEPEALLTAVLKSREKSAPELRLLRQSGSFTVTPIYVVGFYVDKQILGQSAGETVAIARNMAARESLKILFGTHDLESRSPYQFSRDHHLDDWKNRTNQRLLSEIPDNEASMLLNISSSLEEEPLTPDLLNTTYKNVIEPTLGVVLRRRLKHCFYKGTPMRKLKRNYIQPKPETI